VLALWNYHLAPVSAQICNNDNTSALRVYWHIAHPVNDPTFGTTGAAPAQGIRHLPGDGHGPRPDWDFSP